MAEWTGWPSTTGHEHWPGAWSYGVDFTPDGCRRVLAVRLGGGEIKYGTDWTGPIDITVPGAAEALEAWAAVRLRRPRRVRTSVPGRWRCVERTDRMDARI